MLSNKGKKDDKNKRYFVLEKFFLVKEEWGLFRLFV